MNTDYTHITFLLDRSGSMQKVKDDTIGGFNSFIKAQKKIDKPATMSFYQFDDRFEPNYLFKPLKEVEELNDSSFQPRGWTCLLDAIGRAIVETGEALNSLKEENKPGKVVFVVQTDGKENRSKEFTHEDITKLVKQQGDQYQWEFVFLGAKLEAVKKAEDWGIKSSNTMQYAHNARGMSGVMCAVSSNLASYRSGGKADMSFEQKDRDVQKEAGVEMQNQSTKIPNPKEKNWQSDWKKFSSYYNKTAEGKAKIDEAKKRVEAFGQSINAVTKPVPPKPHLPENTTAKNASWYQKLFSKAK